VVPSAVQDFRRKYRERHISPRYSGILHLAFTSLGSLAVVALAVQQVRDLHVVELVTAPLTFLFANYVEYRGHKGPMHRSTGGLALLFERHTEQHHRFFTDEAMSYEGRRDYKMVLFPPVMLLFFLGAIAAPVGGALFLVASRNVAWLYVVTAVDRPAATPEEPAVASPDTPRPVGHDRVQLQHHPSDLRHAFRHPTPGGPLVAVGSIVARAKRDERRAARRSRSSGPSSRQVKRRWSARPSSSVGRKRGRVLAGFGIVRHRRGRARLPQGQAQDVAAAAIGLIQEEPAVAGEGRALALEQGLRRVRPVDGAMAPTSSGRRRPCWPKRSSADEDRRLRGRTPRSDPF